ncbi:MAG: phage holin [Oscillospiraceae bacterium]|nr:phage holin [Oscillospiraceae bacterium]
MSFNNKVYNILKWIALILLPAVSTLIMSLGDIWGLDCKEQICLTITAIDTFLGALLAISTAAYKGEGKIAIDAGSNSCVVLFNEEDTLEKAQKSGKILLTVESADKILDEATADT